MGAGGISSWDTRSTAAIEAERFFAGCRHQSKRRLQKTIGGGCPGVNPQENGSSSCPGKRDDRRDLLLSARPKRELPMQEASPKNAVAGRRGARDRPPA